MPKASIRLRPDNTIAFLWDDTLAEALEVKLGAPEAKAEITRASEVEPLYIDGVVRGWSVLLKYGPAAGKYLWPGMLASTEPYPWSHRELALEAEKQYFNTLLAQ